MIAAALPPGLGKMLEASGLRQHCSVPPERRAERQRPAHPRAEFGDGASGHERQQRGGAAGRGGPALLAVGAPLWFLMLGDQEDGA